MCAEIPTKKVVKQFYNGAVLMKLVPYKGMDTAPNGVAFYVNNGEGGVIGVRVYPDGRKVAVNPATNITDGTKGINRKRKQRYQKFVDAWGHHESIYASHAVYDAWSEVPKPDGMTIDHIDGNPLTPQRVYALAHKYLAHLPQLSRKGAHVLRHSFATNMLAEGADLMAVKELLGHASLQSTEVYTHLTPKDIIENYKQAHPRAK